MRGEELHDILRLATGIATIGLICVLLAFFTSTARELYNKESVITEEGVNLRNKSEDYLFEYGTDVTGNDVVEFIVRHDNQFDYIIKIESKTYKITNDQYKYLLQNPSKIPKGETNANCLWSQEFLVNTVMGNDIYSKYMVNIDKTNARKVYEFVMK